MIKVIIRGGESDPRYVPRENFPLRHWCSPYLQTAIQSPPNGDTLAGMSSIGGDGCD